MTQLYAWDEEPSDKVLDVYFSRIRGKLRRFGAPSDLIQTGWARGHMIEAAPVQDVLAA